jgi:hypothetical protein
MRSYIEWEIDAQIGANAFLIKIMVNIYRIESRFG